MLDILNFYDTLRVQSEIPDLMPRYAEIHKSTHEHDNLSNARLFEVCGTCCSLRLVLSSFSISFQSPFSKGNVQENVKYSNFLRLHGADVINSI